MDFLDLVKERFSVRDFLPKEIESDKLNKILLAGNLAPTARNIQPQRIYVLKSKEALEKMKEITKMVYNAPIVLLVCVALDEVWKNPLEEGYTTSEMDASIVGTHMMLEAWNLGVASVWIRYFDANRISKEFNLAPNIKPIFLLPIGYKTDKVIPSPSHSNKKDLKEIIKYL